MMSHQIENINRGRNYLKNIFLNEINSLEKLKSIFEHKEERFCKTEDEQKETKEIMAKNLQSIS